MINPKKRGCQGGWGQENHSVSKHLHFYIIKVKETVEIIVAAEVIMADAANEATEIDRFT